MRATVYISSVAFRVSGGPFEFDEGVTHLGVLPDWYEPVQALA